MKRERFNHDWIFYSAEDPAKKQKICLPHDAMIYEPRIPKLKFGAFFGYYPSGDYYYEKEFTAPEEYTEKNVYLEFEGVYMDSHVFLNGEEIGGHVYGYSNFYVDLTGKLRAGQVNQIRVFVHNSQAPNGRWYTGSGIYRPVNLIVGERSHIALDGVRIVTRSYEPAELEVDVQTVEAEDCTVLTELYDEDRLVASGNGSHCVLRVSDAKLWNAEHPFLYRAKVSLCRNGTVIDVDEQKIGIRHLEWSAENGLLVNGEEVKLRGGCVHSNNGPIGAASFRETEFRRIRILKESGFNAIRGAHDPRAKDFLDACDELGMYVIEEGFDSWFQSVGTYGYVLSFREEWEKDLRTMVKKCWNRPSVIMYSIGNEIAESSTPEGVLQGEAMVKVCHELDDSRPVTMGLNLILNVLNMMGIKTSVGGTDSLSKDDIVDPKSEEPGSGLAGSNLVNAIVRVAGKLTQLLNRPHITDKASREIFGKLDIAGYNYCEKCYQKHHEWYPDRIMYGSETYPAKLYDNWELVKAHPYVIGDFMWTAWDYYGECGIGIVDYVKNSGYFSKPYPAQIAGCGAHDITGEKDSTAYYAAVVWGVYDKPYIGVRKPKNYAVKTHYAMYREIDTIPCWTFAGDEGLETEVIVYSIGTSIELRLNGKTVKRKNLEKCQASFVMPYSPGTLEAISYDENGTELARSQLMTASDESLLSVRAEKSIITAGCEDLCYINVSVTDKKGICKPVETTVHVDVQGAGTLLAVGSGAPYTEESNTGDSYTTYNGKMQAIVRSGDEPGEILVSFWADGMEKSSVLIRSVKEG